MGASESKQENPVRLLLADERDALENLQHFLNDAGEIRLRKLQERFTVLPETFLSALLSYFQQVSAELGPSKKAEVNSRREAFTDLQFGSAAYRLIRGGVTVKETFFKVGYVGGSTDTQAAAKSFVQDLASVAIAFYAGKSTSTFRVSDRFVSFLLAGPQREDEHRDAASVPFIGPFQTWFGQNHYLARLWEIAFTRIFLMDPAKLASREAELRATTAKRPNLHNGVTSLLAFEDMWFLEMHLPAEHKPLAWRRLFNSEQQGMSWTLFQHAVEEMGSTLVVVKDRGGAIFGGFASQEWKPLPKYYGDNESFIFRLQPTIVINRASNYNQNFQYFNHSTQTLPNGLGLGGQMGYFALWIDAENFGRGHSKGNPSTTYNSRQLSSTEEFQVDLLEAWLIKEKEVDPNLLPEKGKRSILDRAEDMAFLELGGRKLYSKDVREGGGDREADFSE
ncbi:TLD-domain-containing protein [Gonapodya prolifera JEL478]|uniref:MTOR-associated protein MEAK7 n=1 Tax=Gonapodya prolifera (strain JEL478) TaxID=1344416 RepID=A0A139AUC0_GONPJ|nr:TLD-domain-containing protein [Gonapodya prolifera JEL478]|eukprot:KXS20332.1 TLD-domain-containing protein [Gonapodya prolifera JEL478]